MLASISSFLLCSINYRGLEALKAGREYAQERYSVDLRKIHGEGERDHTRRLFGEFLRVDICTSFFPRCSM
jgi:hypothetical protein